MGKRLSIRYGGVPDLDRTVALQSGEVSPNGIELDYVILDQPPDVLRGIPEGLDAVEATLFDFLTSATSGSTPLVAIPVFTARYLPTDLLWTRGDTGPQTLHDLQGARIAYRATDPTARVWADVWLSTVLGNSDAVDWMEVTDEITEIEALETSDAMCCRPPVGDDLVRVSSERSEVLEHLESLGGVLPIFHLVVLRRDVYEENHWIAVELMDAFVRSKFIGLERVRYFGALAVSLPWLRRAVDAVDSQFQGDAYPYGLAENMSSLQRFMESAFEGEVAGSLDLSEVFAVETVEIPGAPNTTKYVVPLSGVRR